MTSSVYMAILFAVMLAVFSADAGMKKRPVHCSRQESIDSLIELLHEAELKPCHEEKIPELLKMNADKDDDITDNGIEESNVRDISMSYNRVFSVGFWCWTCNSKMKFKPDNKKTAVRKAVHARKSRKHTVY